MRFIAVSICVLLLALTAALAAVEGVEIKLAGGEVKGKVRGQGRADVSASVTNNTGRYIDGLRVGVFYSAADTLPVEGSKWRVHEFIFDPPLAPGASTALSFSDENALEYVKLEAQRVRYAYSLRYAGSMAELAVPLSERDGVLYAATRDLLELIGGTLGFDPKSNTLTLTREGRVVKLKTGQKTAQVDGRKQPLAHPVLEVEGRSMLPLEEIAAFFGLKVSRDEEQRVVTLE